MALSTGGLSTGMDKAPQRIRMDPPLGQREHYFPFLSPGGYRIELRDSRGGLAPAGFPEDLQEH